MESSASSAVFDASVFVRAIVDDDGRAYAWLAAAETRQVALHVPDLIWVEVANAMKLAVAAGRISDDDARRAISAVSAFPARVRRIQELVAAAFERSLVLPLTVYDACYLVLAEAAKATLVTFDRDFAGLYEPLELLV